MADSARTEVGRTATAILGWADRFLASGEAGINYSTQNTLYHWTILVLLLIIASTPVNSSLAVVCTG